jgi:hypothetical protein
MGERNKMWAVNSLEQINIKIDIENLLQENHRISEVVL